MISLILLVFALVLAIIASVVNPVEPWRGRLGCLALACYFGSELAKAIPGAR